METTKIKIYIANILLSFEFGCPLCRFNDSTSGLWGIDITIVIYTITKGSIFINETLGVWKELHDTVKYV